MSVAGYGDVKYFMELPIEELRKMLDEVGQITKERKRRNMASR